jgi:hypothetical protein
MADRKRVPKSPKHEKGFNRMAKSTKASILRKPLLWSAIIGIGGYLLAFFFYQAGRATRKLTYLVDPIKTTVVKAGQTSRLEVSCDGEKIASDVTAVKIAIWNDGKKSIESSDILKPIILCSDPPVPILDATVKPSSRALGFSINRDLFAAGKLPISWQILEGGHGGAIQVIYAGPQEIRFKVKGIIKEQLEIGDATFHGRISGPEKSLSDAKMNKSAFIAMGIIFLIGGVFMRMSFTIAKQMKGRFKKRSPQEIEAARKRDKEILIFSYVALIGGLCLLISGLFIFKMPHNPPFGF